jgi:hypothetical protein
MRTLNTTAYLKSSLLIFCLAVQSLGHVEGAITRRNSPSEFAPAATLITFAGLAPTGQPTNVAGVGLILQNGRGPDVALDPSRVREFGPSEGTIIQNIASGFSDLNIYLPRPVFQCGFELRTWPSESITLSFYSSASLLDTLTVPTRTTDTGPSAPLLFYGFESSTTFDHLLIAVRGPSSNFLELDNLRFATVPEPDTLPLVGVGLALYGAVRSKLAAARATSA